MSRSGLVNRCLAAVCFLLVPVQLLQCNASVILTSSFEDQGRVAACPEEEVVFTCRTIETPFLFWQSDQFPETRFRFNSPQNVPMFPGEFTATLTEFVEDPNEANSGNFTSTLAVTATVGLNGTVIACTDTIMTEDQTLLVAGMAAPPLNPRSIVQTYHRHNFTVRVEWEDSPSGADTYTISSDTSMETVPGSETSAILTLSYNMVHTASITATLCGDISEAVTVDITKVSCEDLTPPSNGSIGDYESTAEGTEVNYQCDYGLIPGGEMMTTCLADGTWSPDPVELECAEPPQSDCGSPVLSPNAFVEDYSDTVEGPVVIYSCNPGLIPEGEFRSVCREDTDTWDPDPASASAMCREPGTPADCGYPDPPVNGSFVGDITSTVEGSEITYQCDDGLTPEGTMTAVCGEDGEWRPNPGDVECRKNDTLGSNDTNGGNGSDESNALSSGAVTSIAVVVTFVVAFTLGNITGALILYCIICTVRRKGCYSTNQEPQPPAPEYEQVSLEPRKIELRENVAYGPM